MKNHFLKSLQAALFSSAILIGAQTFAQVAETATSTVYSAGTISELGTDRIVIKSETSPEPLSYTYSKTTTYVDETGAPVSLELVKSGLPATVYYTTVGDARVATKVVVQRSTTPAAGTATAVIATPAVTETKAVMPTSGASTTTTTAATPSVTATTTTVAPGASATTTVNVPGTSSTVANDTTTNRTISTIGTIREFAPDRIVIMSDSSPDAPLTYVPTKTTTYVDETGAPVSVDVVKSGLPVTIHYAREGGSLVATKVVMRRSTIAQPVVVPSATVIETAPPVVAPPPTTVIRERATVTPPTVVRERATVVEPAPVVREKKTEIEETPVKKRKKEVDVVPAEKEKKTVSGDKVLVKERTTTVTTGPANAVPAPPVPATIEPGVIEKKTTTTIVK